ncbi:diguanylate cyclase (GGDEF)-like protein [Modicisalibacter xianhensis]|uniref:Diguanylate cyclase (GGDEF)-like protein n=1 Tax=Modicisalibacter xianhensis TaxID=442341 RepID=A0A4R8G9N9_9GAMM|nr:bifunctional diguanylate cyclase/phosphodiesterase [Halomonas xianhensis]TDX32242.1 diguanylate cyclase (GGDEF)-like protein [Halomonas xianhensis]
MLANFRHGLGLLLLGLALGASHLALSLLPTSLYSPPSPLTQRQRNLLNRLQGQLLSWQAPLHTGRTDPLTGLGTHGSALQEIDRLVSCNVAFSLIRLSVDNVKQINKTLGHALGDQFLIALSRRLLALGFHRGRLYRLGGNEFLMLVTQPESYEAGIDRLRDRLCVPLELDGTALVPALTLADLKSPEHGQEPRRLLRRSAIALGLARDANDGYYAYQSGHDQHHERDRLLLRDLVRAVRDQQLQLVYQPKIRIADGALEGFEALLQWQHPAFGILQPDEFLPLAAQSGHMALISEWMLSHVVWQLADWQRQGKPQTVAVNLTADDLEDIQLPQRLLSNLHAHGVAPQSLMIEITEQAVMRDPGLAARLLSELRDHGIRVAIDDFGTGYSSLAQLRHLPLDALKIDKSFVLDLPLQPEDAVIVRASVMLAHNFGLQVIAEGVETQQHLALLAEADCDQAQGYLISRPLDAANVLAWIEGYRTPYAERTSDSSARLP